MWLEMVSYYCKVWIHTDACSAGHNSVCTHVPALWSHTSGLSLGSIGFCSWRYCQTLQWKWTKSWKKQDETVSSIARSFTCKLWHANSARRLKEQYFIVLILSQWYCLEMGRGFRFLNRDFMYLLNLFTSQKRFLDSMLLQKRSNSYFLAGCGN